MSRLALVSCVKRKRTAPAPARDLYTSTLFRLLRQHAEANSDRWLILSAEHGVVDPDTVLAPYERTLLRMSSREQREWAARVRAQLVPHLAGVTSVLLLAGERYRQHLVDFLEQNGRTVDIPLRGLSIGRQLKWLTSRTDG